MRTPTETWTLARIVTPGLALLLALGGCGAPEDAPMDDMPMGEGMEMEMEGMGMEGMEMDREMMQRHADEAEAMAAELRSHVAGFQGLSPQEQYDRISEHTAVVARMVGLVERQMAEMSMGMPMDDEEMGAMMGMSAQEHLGMRGEVAAVRSEAEELQTASAGELGARMGPHLERLEAMAGTLVQVAQAMREI